MGAFSVLFAARKQLIYHGLLSSCSLGTGMVNSTTKQNRLYVINRVEYRTGKHHVRFSKGSQNSDAISASDYLVLLATRDNMSADYVETHLLLDAHGRCLSSGPSTVRDPWSVRNGPWTLRWPRSRTT